MNPRFIDEPRVLIFILLKYVSNCAIKEKGRIYIYLWYDIYIKKEEGTIR